MTAGCALCALDEATQKKLHGDRGPIGSGAAGHHHSVWGNRPLLADRLAGWQAIKPLLDGGRRLRRVQCVRWELGELHPARGQVPPPSHVPDR